MRTNEEKFDQMKMIDFKTISDLEAISDIMGKFNILFFLKNDFNCKYKPIDKIIKHYGLLKINIKLDSMIEIELQKLISSINNYLEKEN